MNQQGPSSNVPVKRKRGRPRKDQKGENVPTAVMPCPDNVLNSNQTTGTGDDDCDDEMVGKAVTGVIDGTFNAGYLLNVKVENTDDLLKGVVFLPDQVAPVTVENDVAPHAKMIIRKEISIPVLNQQAEVHESVPSSVKFNKQSFEPELPVRMSEERVLHPQAEIHGSVSSSVQYNKQSFEPELPVPVSEERVLNPQAEIHGSVPSPVKCNMQSFEPELPVHKSEERVHSPQEEIHGSVSSSVQCNKQSFEPELPVPMSEEGILNAQEEIHGSVPLSVQRNKQCFEPELPVPMSEERVLNPQAELHGSVSSPVQCNKQSFEPELDMPMSEERVLPTETPSGISVLLDNQSASTLIPISGGGVPQGISEPEHVTQSASIVSELDHDKTVKLGETLHELDASTQVKESSADGEETTHSGAAFELINLLPSLENTKKELRTGQQTLPHVRQLNEVIHDKPVIELNLIPLSAEPEALPCEQSSKTVDYFVEKQELPKTNVVEDTKTKLTIGTSSNVDASTSNVRPSTDAVNIPVVGSSHALEISQPESMSSEQSGKSVPSESKFSFEEQDLCERRDP